eukprot:Opistho-2@82927
MAAGRKSARITPLLGLAFLISAITPLWPAAILARSAASKPRTSVRASASSRWLARERFLRAAATSSTLTSQMRCRMSAMLRHSQRLRGGHELRQLGPRRAAGDQLARPGDTLGDRVHHIGGVERRTGIEDDDVAGRTFLVVQRADQHLARLLGTGDLEAAVADHREAEVLGVDLVLAHLAVPQLAHQGGRAQRDLVHAVLAIDHHGMLGAQALHHAHLDAHQIGMEHTHQDVLGIGRIGQRAEDVEDGAHAQFAAHRGDVLHRRMVVRREHEADAGLRNALGHLGRAQHDVGAQGFQHIGAAGLAGDAAVAVFGDLGTAGRGDEHGAGRDPMYSALI